MDISALKNPFYGNDISTKLSMNAYIMKTQKYDQKILSQMWTK